MGLFRFTGNKKKIITNVLWAMAGKTINLFGQFLVGILVARYLGPEQYGIMNYVISYVFLFTIISSFGLSNIEVRELAKNPHDINAIMGTSFRLRLAFSTIAYILLGLSLLIFRTDAFTSCMIMTYGLILYTGSFDVIRNYFTSIVKNKYVVKTEISRTIIGAGIKIFLLWIKAPLALFIIATMFDTILVASGYCISYKTYVGKISDWFYKKELAPYLIKQSFPLLLSGAAVIVYQRIDQVMIGNMIDKESVGYFSTAGRFLELIIFLPHVLSQTISPLLVNLYQKEDKSLYQIKSQQFVDIVVWTSIIMSFIVSLSAYWLVRYTFGERYLLAVPVLQIIAFKTVGQALSSAGGQLIIIEHIQKWAVIRNMLGCLFCVLLNYLLIPHYGIIGSAYVTIVTVFISGYIANALIPSYRHIFIIETKTFLTGWKEFFNIKQVIRK